MRGGPMSLTDGKPEYTNDGVSRWYQAHNDSIVEIRSVESYPAVRDDEVPVRLYARKERGAVYVSLDEAENLALNILAMVRDHRAEVDKYK